LSGERESTNPTQARSPWLRPAVLGTICCAVSAVGYTAANGCMRQLSALGADPTWAVCIKETFTVVVVGPWVLVRALRGLPVLRARPTADSAPGQNESPDDAEASGRRAAFLAAARPYRAFAAVLLTGLTVQLVGNLGMQWAYGVVGLAVTFTATFGTMLTCSALLGWAFLGEPVSRQSIAAIGLLVGSIALLTLGAGQAQPADCLLEGGPWVVLAVLVAAAAGLSFSMLTIAIRTTVTGALPATTILVATTGVGVVTMGALSLARLGVDALLTTPEEQWAWMLAAGLLNLIAFMAITGGLALTSVVRANVLNASQVAMGALAGVWFFNESFNAWLGLGIVSTIVGVTMIGEPEEIQPELIDPAAPVAGETPAGGTLNGPGEGDSS
jgi:drug/metabolite transporter (DMT)-like permease